MTESDRLKIAVIISSFNSFITKKLLDGAMDAFQEKNIAEDCVNVFWVPGSYEIPLALAEVAGKGYEMAVCLGAVIKGETPHFNYVCEQASRGISRISIDHRLPVGFGVITAATTEQALDRAGGKKGNKGREAALAAIEMAGVIEEIRKN